MDLKSFMFTMFMTFIQDNDAYSVANAKLLKSYFQNNRNNRSNRYARADIKKFSVQSDAMKLYSISAKKFLKVKEEKGEKSWAPIFQMSLTSKKDTYKNKFVTESVMYHNLRIRSPSSKNYICGNNKGDIIFKPSAFRGRKSASKGQKSRRRCEFTWDFTSQMHIELQIEALSLYLAVKNNQVILVRKEESTELERSFIWIPTRNLRPRGRSFSDDMEENTCDSMSQKLRKLSSRVKKLNESIFSLNSEMKRKSCPKIYPK